MRPDDAIATLHRAGSKAVRERDHRVNRAQREGIELGAIGNLLKTKYGQSQSKTAAELGIPQTTLSGWMVKATEAGHAAEDPIDRALTIDIGRIGAYVADNGITIDRIVTTRSKSEMLAVTNLPIESFSNGRHVRVPLMMAHNADNGTWIGIDTVMPGVRGGTGAGNAERAAREFGLDKDLARVVAYTDECCDIDVFGGIVTHPVVDTSAYPQSLPDPHPDSPAIFVKQFDRGALDEWVRGQRGGSTSHARAMDLRSWLGFLTHPEPPSWAQGPLRVRVYITAEAAEADGFMKHDGGGFADVSQVILERGRTQLWLSLWPVGDPARWVADEVYDLLAAVGRFPKEFDELDVAAMLRRWIRERTSGRVRPCFLDIGPGGEPDAHGLDFVPVRSAR